MTKPDYFSKFVGQDAVKRTLTYHLETFGATRQVPFLLLVAARGIGKTSMAKAFGSHLTKVDGTPRVFIELNCSQLKNQRTFFENIFLPLLNDNEATVLFDEAHNMPNDFAQALLTICNTDPNPVRVYNFNEANYTFNFKKLTFIFATTEPDQIFHALKDRMEVVEFQEYNPSQLSTITKNMLAPAQHILSDTLTTIATTLRGNARAAVKTGERITAYLTTRAKNVFGDADWKELSLNLGILPHGLSNSEVQVLRHLNVCGPLTLQMLVAKTGFSRSAIQRDVENYLLKKGFIQIDGKRKITPEGQAALADVEAFQK